MLLNKKELFLIIKTLDQKTKFKFILFLLLVIIVASLEYITISESVIFAKKLLGTDLNNNFLDFLGINHSLIFLILIVFTNIGRALVLYNGIRLAYISSSQVCQRVYSNYLTQSYLDFLNTNSSELISIVTAKTKILATDLILPLIYVLSSSLMMIFIGVSIFKKAPQYSLFSIFSLFLGYLIISIITSKSLKKNSQIMSRNSSENIKIVQESVTSFREIKLTNLENRFFNLFAKNEYKLRISDSNIRILGELPRYIIESLILAMIIILSMIFTSSNSNSDNSIIISSLGAFLYGSQRLLPLAQNTYRSFSTIRSSTFSVKDILNYVEINKKERNIIEEEISFNESIILQNIGFKYNKSNKYVLKEFNFKINKGETVCILGPSGCGKSTVMDILMGLIKPSEGKVLLDGKELNNSNINSWQNKLSHVPQEILLTDDSIKRNIAFGLNDEDINNEKLNYVVRLSSLDKLIKNFKYGLNTNVGERGTFLSGGQRQRIGIARALYQDKEVILLDEATSALDKKTEEEILKKITRLNKNITLIIITHRPRTEIKYDKVIKVEDYNQVI